MARRRGFFAEMQHQARLAEQRQRQQQRATAQAHARAVREAERAQREFERTQAASARQVAAESAYAAKERARLHEQARLAEVERLNAKLAEQSEAIDSLSCRRRWRSTTTSTWRRCGSRSPTRRSTDPI